MQPHSRSETANQRGKKRRSSAPDTLNEADFEELLSQSQVAQKGRCVKPEVVSDTAEGLKVPLEFKPLNPTEQKEKQRLENIVIGAVWTAGAALRELRDKRLYRETHASFEEYCHQKFGHSRQKSDYLIVGANIYENLTSNRCQILPTTEYQVRPLGGLEPPRQVASMGGSRRDGRWESSHSSFGQKGSTPNDQKTRR